MICFDISLVVLLFLQMWLLYWIEQWLDRPAGTPRLKTWGLLWVHTAARLENFQREDEDSRVDMADWLVRFRQAMSLLPDGVVIIDSVMHLEWCNPGAERHLGLDRARDVTQTEKLDTLRRDFIANASHE
ncbi:MAG: PAS domain-containing protein [Glaciimonas sp.]|nr:PAS domain-containing protein [Glaciimonas sp.]